MASQENGKAPKPKRGDARMRELGYRKVIVWLDPIEVKAIKEFQLREDLRLPLGTLARLLLCEASGRKFYHR